MRGSQKTSLKAKKNYPRFGRNLFYFFKLVSSSPWPFCCFSIVYAGMYASFRSVTDKNSKILTPTRTGNFLFTSVDWEFYATWKEAKLQLSRHRNRARHTHSTGIYNDGRDGWRMPEILLKISRAIICKKARELRHNNFMGQGESVLCNFAERAPMPKGIENPEKEELRC